MGKLAELRKEYIITPKDTPRDREIVEEIKKIVESEWWDINVGKPFNWPKKFDQKRNFLFGFGPEFFRVGNFLIHKHEFCQRCGIYKGLISTEGGIIHLERS